MRPVLSRDQIRAFDRHAIDGLGVPSLVLMENAGKNSAATIHRRLAPQSRVVVVCGPGNNGGDGFVVARHLLGLGHRVRTLLIGAAQKLSPDARVNHDVWRALGGSVESAESLDDAAQDADAIVDALFGTGLDREIREPARSVIEAINRSTAARFALDIPSGLDADTGKVLGTAVRADHTVTFAHLKAGLLTSAGADLCGTVEVADIGVPGTLVAQVGSVAEALETSDVAALIRPRAASTHKGSAGRLVAFAGSPGKTGAALLVARGALRAGAGLVTIATFREAREAIDRRVLEEMTALLEPQQLGDGVAALLSNASAAAIGPGFGHGGDPGRVIEQVVLDWDGTVVVDADALTYFAGQLARLANAKGRLVLTPHPAELGRLLGVSTAEIEDDRFGAARRAADLARAVVVLKGVRTVIAAPDALPAVNCSGSPALATGGAGDVLTGITAALCCSLAPRDAALAAVHVHGLAAERWSARTPEPSDRGLLAHEIADELPGVLAALTRNHAALTV